MRSVSRRSLAALVLLTMVVTIAGPVSGVATALVGPFWLPVGQTEPAASPELEASPEPEPGESSETEPEAASEGEAQPEEAPSAADDAGTPSHGCAEGGDVGTLVGCLTEASSACMASQSVTCADDPMQAVIETVSKPSGQLSPCEEGGPESQPGCAEGLTRPQTQAAEASCGTADAECTAEQIAGECSGGVAARCEGAVEDAVMNAVCAGAAGCPSEPIPSLRDCIVWTGASPTPDVECVRKAVVAAICATQGQSCVLTHPAVASLFSLPQACATPTGEPCQKGLQALVVAALCAHTAACFPSWAQEAAKCKGANDLGCHALGLLHEACRGRTCPPELTSLEPCVAGAATQKCGDKDFQTFMRGWIADLCFARGGASSACPRQAEIRRPRVLADPPAVDGVGDPAGVSEPNVAQLQNGSATFPFLSIANAMSALRAPQAQHLDVRGPLNIGAGTYAEGLSISANEAARLVLNVTTPGSELPIIAPTSGPGLTLATGHRLRILEPVVILGGPSSKAIQGPVSDASLSLGSDRIYVNGWNLITADYENEVVGTPEEVRVELRVEGTAQGLTVERLVSGEWSHLPLSNGSATLATIQPGLFEGDVPLRVRATEAASVTVSLALVGKQTGVIYDQESGAFDVIVPQAPPTPPPSVPRTPDTELPPAVRIAGEDRSETAAAVSRASFPDGAEQVFVATGQSFADALAAGPAASRSASPVVLVERDHIPDATHAEIERLKPTGVRLMGGTAAIGEQVEAQLKAMGVEVARLRGADRYATAAAVSAAHFTPGVPVAYVAGGEGFADALSGGAAAAALGGPVLLVQRGDLPSSTSEELRRLRPGRVVVLGGRQAVSDEVAEGLREFAGDVRRVSGPTRYATSAAVSRDAFGVTGGTVYVATGETFPDALAGVPAAGAQRAPLMLVEPDRLPPEIAAELDRLAPKRIVILGGERSVTQRLERELRSYQVP